MAHSLLRMPGATALSLEDFHILCHANPELTLERTAKGDLEIMPPSGGETGARKARLLIRLGIWNEATGLGVVCGSATGFHLPNGAERAPDVSWVRSDRWNSIAPVKRESWLPLAPDFVLEMLAPYENIPNARAKLKEYIDNGVQLGWLINRGAGEVEIYRPDAAEVDVVSKPKQLTGNPVLPGFVLRLDDIW